jgi:hypothetical protein
MFSSDTYIPTLSGPIGASGEQLRRNRSAAMAQSQFGGNQRAFRQQASGLGAGSRLDAYRSGIQADTEAAKGFAAAQKSLLDNLKVNADAAMQFQANRAGEQSGIRELMLRRNTGDQNRELDLKKLFTETQLQNKQRLVENKAADLKRQASTGGLLMGLFNFS